MKKAKHELVRHGDLMIKPINGSVKGVAAKKLTLAEGEFTGHSHQLTPGQGGSIVWREPEPEVKEFEVIDVPATLTHEEHEAIELAPGSYRVEIQEAYDYFNEEMRKVVD